MNLSSEQKQILNRILDLAQGVHGVPDPQNQAEQVGKQIFQQLLQLDRNQVQQILSQLNS